MDAAHTWQRLESSAQQHKALSQQHSATRYINVFVWSISVSASTLQAFNTPDARNLNLSVTPTNCKLASSPCVEDAAKSDQYCVNDPDGRALREHFQRSPRCLDEKESSWPKQAEASETGPSNPHTGSV